MDYCPLLGVSINGESTVAIVRGDTQTIVGNINVIMMLTTDPPPPLLSLAHS